MRRNKDEEGLAVIESFYMVICVVSGLNRKVLNPVDTSPAFLSLFLRFFPFSPFSNTCKRNLSDPAATRSGVKDMENVSAAIFGFL